MLDALRKLITDFGDEGHHPSRFRSDDYRLAACALLVHTATIDGAFSDAERRRLHGLVMQRFGIDDAAADELIGEAVEVERRSIDLYQFTARLNRTLDEALALVRSELDVHAAERRRALHELEERMARRERDLTEQAQREEVDAVQRVREGFEDVSRRQIEQLERAVDRAVASHADEAAQRFAQLVKTSREDAAKRLARELERAVDTFSREAETVLAERLAHGGDAGAQRLESRVSNVGKDLERRHDELVAAQDQRLSELESEMRHRIEGLRADVEAERGVLEARLQELMRRYGSATTVRGA